MTMRQILTSMAQMSNLGFDLAVKLYGSANEHSSSTTSLLTQFIKYNQKIYKVYDANIKPTEMFIYDPDVNIDTQITSIFTSSNGISYISVYVAEYVKHSTTVWSKELLLMFNLRGWSDEAYWYMENITNDVYNNRHKCLIG